MKPTVKEEIEEDEDEEAEEAGESEETQAPTPDEIAEVAEPTEEPVPRSDESDEERGRSPTRKEGTRKRPRTKPRRIAHTAEGEDEEIEVPRSRKDLIDYIDHKSVRKKRWKYDFDVKLYITDADIEMLFREEEDMNRTRNHRSYIGPGSDGSSNDKIAVEFRYRNRDNSVSFDTPWNDYVKTTYVHFHGEK